MFTSPLQLWSLHPGLGEALQPGLQGLSPTGPMKGTATNREARLEEGLSTKVRPRSSGFPVQMLHCGKTFPSSASTSLILTVLGLHRARGFSLVVCMWFSLWYMGFSAYNVQA